MTVSAKLYGSFFLSLANKEMNLGSDSLKAMLLTSTYAPNQDTHRYKSDLTNEITGTGYTAGGQALTSVAVTYDGASNTWKLTSANPAWASSTLTARYLVYYDATPATDATRPLIAYVDFGADVSTTSGTFTDTIDAAGIATITVA